MDYKYVIYADRRYSSMEEIPAENLSVLYDGNHRYPILLGAGKEVLRFCTKRKSFSVWYSSDGDHRLEVLTTKSGSSHHRILKIR